MATPVVDEIFRIIPDADMPPGQNVVILEIRGEQRWLIREGAPMADIIADLNRLGTHLTRHGVWTLRRDDARTPPPHHIRHAS